MIKKGDKKLKKSIYFFFTFIILLFLICCGTKDEEYNSPKVHEINGITHIVNPVISQNPPRKFYLKEELSIGNNENSNFLLGVVRDIDIDGYGNIYILDGRYCCVQVFNPQGKHLRTIGEKGQGPGELLSPLDLIFSSKDKMIHVLDYKNKKISRYHPDGVLDADIKYNEGFADKLFIIAGYYFIIYEFYDKKGFLKYKVVKYDYNGKMLLQSDEFLAVKDKAIKKGNFTITGGSPFGASRYFTHDSMNKIYTGFSDKYEISILDLDFNLIKVIQKRSTTQIKVTQEEKDDFLNNFKERQKKKGRPISNQLLKLIQFPEYYPLFKGMWIDDQNRLLIKTMSKDGKVHIDVFRKDGIYIDKMLISELSGDIAIDRVFHYDTLFRDDYVYSEVKDNNGEWMVKKYRIIEKK